ncbi:hypothetical protein [Streptomyces sp. SM12]|uniref:hypothetical protein n=1 Tax=Streptomyces sp. SM12 TaxID=1071602 RepID=UPI000CD5C524|nr:hypothetical protein [Streptomyces sp. SM12]
MEELAVAAGTALVGAMATEGWNAVRSGAVALWRKVHPERVATVEAELEEARAELVATDDPDEIEAEMAREWRRRFRRLLAEQPELADELRRMVEQQWQPQLPLGGVRNVTMKADVRDRGRAYQSAGDQHFHRE